MPNLVFLTRPSNSDVAKNLDCDIPDFRISGQSFMKENCFNSRNSNGVDRKLGAGTKFNKRNTKTFKNFDKTSCQQILTPLSCFQFMANLKQPGN